MIYDSERDELNLGSYNESLFMIASKLDKCLMLLVSCGFSLHNLLSEPENNIYVETMPHLIKKLEVFVKCVDLISKVPDSEDKEKFYSLLVNQVKTFLKHLSELQHSEALLMYNTLDQFL
jgi:hypothetical protein